MSGEQKKSLERQGPGVMAIIKYTKNLARTVLISCWNGRQHGVVEKLWIKIEFGPCQQKLFQILDESLNLSIKRTITVYKDLSVLEF